MNNKQFVVDTLCSIVFWVPVGTVLNIFILRLEYWQIILAACLIAISNASLGGIYGRFLNHIRSKAGVIIK